MLITDNIAIITVSAITYIVNDISVPMLTGKSSQDIIEFAVAASALKHTIEGDMNLVSVSEVEALVKNGGSGRVQR